MAYQTPTLIETSLATGASCCTTDTCQYQTPACRIGSITIYDPACAGVPPVRVGGCVALPPQNVVSVIVGGIVCH
jgi:hypothetical protein